ncbi:hypothetical protein [Rickettsia endosymbiont of Ceutorhynchus obstrictus]|uniref:hypothetical protein n=1 Tax=Rickettsia endosymbiont of Ceutorhynchus obstrictus TaxID=3066249 RepID=UPI003132DC43
MTQYTVLELAEWLNLTDRRIQLLVKDKVIPKPDKGKYDLKACTQKYVKYLQQRAFGKTGTDSIDQHAEKSRLIKAKADKAELEVQILESKYMEVSEVEFEWSNLVLAFRSKMLALPTKLVRSLAEAGGNFVEIEKILETEIYEALLELSKYEPEEESDNGNNQQQVSTAAETDSISMG